MRVYHPDGANPREDEMSKIKNAKTKRPKGVSLQILVDPNTSAFSSGGKQEKILENASDALANLGRQLQESAKGFLSTLEKAGADEIKLGLNLAIEAGGSWLVISGKAGATASVELTWKKH
jgi:hypothetical protein